jgi:hypothetical protein
LTGHLPGYNKKAIGSFFEKRTKNPYSFSFALAAPNEKLNE